MNPRRRIDMTRIVIVQVTFEYPPIPIRRFDYRAGVVGEEERNRCGWGQTVQAALDDLIRREEADD
jgi:hypothetical protein